MGAKLSGEREASMNKWALRLIVVVSIAAGMLAFGYAWISNSTAYALTVQLAKTSPAISARIGEVRGVSLDLFGMEMEESGASGSAQLATKVRGARGEGRLSVCLIKAASVWSVTAATFNNEFIQGDASGCVHAGR